MSDVAVRGRGATAPEAPAAPESAAPAIKFVEVQVMRKCAPRYLRIRNPDGSLYEGEPTPFDEDGNPVMQPGEFYRTVPPDTIMKMEAQEASRFMRSGVVLPTYNSFS